MTITHEGFEHIGSPHQDHALARYQNYWQDEAGTQTIKDQLIEEV